MATVSASIDVAVPVTVAYNQWTQFESFPAFLSGVDSITQLTDTTTRWATTVAGVRHEYTAQITEQHPDERIAWKSTDGTHHAGVVTFHRLDERHCRVNVQFEWGPETFLEKAGAAAGVDSRQVKSDLKQFKDFIEGRGTETGAWRGSVDRPADASTGPQGAAAGEGAAGEGAAGLTGAEDTADTTRFDDPDLMDPDQAGDGNLTDPRRPEDGTQLP